MALITNTFNSICTFQHFQLFTKLECGRQQGENVISQKALECFVHLHGQIYLSNSKGMEVELRCVEHFIGDNNVSIELELAHSIYNDVRITISF